MKKANNKKRFIFWQVIWFIILTTFVGFGGGNAIMPVIKKQAVDKRQWLTEEEFDHVVIITNMLPGASVIEALSYIAIKLLGFWKGMIATIIAILPHCLLAFGLLLLTKYIPKEYLYVIALGILVTIIGLLINFAIRYLKKSFKPLGFTLWFSLFLITLLFSLFIPTPYNMPVFIMLSIIAIFFIVVSIKKKHKKRMELEQQIYKQENVNENTNSGDKHD
ncbi:chromate transporter [Metamycoplasma cloacale]|uniref:Chromate transporter n=1 Tax=Metamycoplasma cloacale TaxID=92401 RepID=A0A2Z4LMF0_9BACT|nr:chromate transporter [Metamycoplasma cloacale]AWX42965.1 chromate transporter [Metamycoplasma cloacale]VEU79211.1 chromate transporter [Metamycoplasma cloacale]